MDTNNIVPDEETILNNIKKIYKGDWVDVLIYYNNITRWKVCLNTFCKIAAYYGHLEVLKYAHENGCPWDEYSCTLAALNGHLNILYYLYENEAPYETPAVIHPNCKEFFETFGEYWEKGDFSLMHNLKPAKYN